MENAFRADGERRHGFAVSRAKHPFPILVIDSRLIIQVQPDGCAIRIMLNVCEAKGLEAERADSEIETEECSQ